MLEAIGEDNVCSISPDELQIYRHPDGREWVLGRGSFGEVRLLTLHCFTTLITLLTPLTPRSTIFGNKLRLQA